MSDKYIEALEGKIDDPQLEKLEALKKPQINEFVADAFELCKPKSVFIATDSAEDIEYVRLNAIEKGEETALAIEGHTVHFDGIKDQGRDTKNTRYLLPPDVHLGEHINHMSKQEGLEDVRGLLDGAMAGKEMIVRFYCLGPKDSIFSQLCCQITDSFYVAHSEDLLYRPGYEDFLKANEQQVFFRFLHSAGKLEHGVSANVEGRRMYIDLEDNIVYSVNTQYGGNTLGLKKLAMRLGVSRSLREGWLTEHMFIVGVPNEEGKVTYITGAFPSMCGKTSTAMLQGQSIVGDDIAYLKKVDGEVRAVNVERGIFGIIADVNPTDDPIIYEALTTPGEAIFSNVLIKDGKPYWMGMGEELPENGINFSGEWHDGKNDDSGKPINPSHKNARYTIKINDLSNCDTHMDDPAGVRVGGIIFGGRDSDISVPVEQSFNWAHGVLTKGASLESETTAATLGSEGVREFNPMSNLDFLAASLDTYIHKYIEFADNLERPPAIFSVNYFLKGKDGEYLNSMIDKKVWITWIEKRINREMGALETPTGFIPLYKDLKELFKSVLGKDYSEDQYKEQFTIRTPELLARIDRIEALYRKEWGIPELLFTTLDRQRTRLEKARNEFGDYISPLMLSQKLMMDQG
ncbi:MAG: phosphoenolpyruvate carboxykinase (GTP) [Actinobacteria bacterium]|nr:phosphoenolpyruvate carboxykinase (GTP) [Actinomycetota bacterium]